MLHGDGVAQTPRANYCCPAVRCVWTASGFFHFFGLDGAIWIAGGSVLFTLPVTFYFKLKYRLFDLRRELMVLPLLLVGYLSGLAINQIFWS